MTETAELEPLGFPRFLHAMLRANDSSEEVARANGVLNWVSENIVTLRGILEASEARLFNTVFQHWVQHGSPTNRVHAEEMVRNEDKPDGMIGLLEDYDGLISNLPASSALDMNQILADRIADWERVKMMDALAQARRITAGVAAPKKDSYPHLKGARDAASYLFDALHTGVIISDNRGIGGSAKRLLFNIMRVHEQNKKDRTSEHLQIRTGISCLDNTIRGFRKPEFIGVLGYAGNFKTTLCRTFLYNALMQGYNCLHIPLESSYEEELMLYGILHAHNPNFKDVLRDKTGIDRRAFEDGTLTDQEVRYLHDSVIPDFRYNLRGEMFIRQPAEGTWPEIKQLIEAEDRRCPLDLVLIDYLALMNMGQSKNETADMNSMIKQVKNLCLTFHGGKGLAIMTPVQGKREGYGRAQDNGGTWTSDGAYMYSEFEKSVDKLVYVYADDELKASDSLKVGTCKSRRTTDAPATIVMRHPQSGYITDPGGGEGREMAGAKRNCKESGW